MSCYSTSPRKQENIKSSAGDAHSSRPSRKPEYPLSTLTPPPNLCAPFLLSPSPSPCSGAREITPPQVNKLVRYNLRQAVNLDIAMFFPSILAFLAQAVLGDGAAKLTPLATVGSDIIFVTVILCVLYSIGSSAFGVLPEKIPGIGAMNREGTRSEKKDEDDGGDSSKGP